MSTSCSGELKINRVLEMTSNAATNAENMLHQMMHVRVASDAQMI